MMGSPLQRKLANLTKRMLIGLASRDIPMSIGPAVGNKDLPRPRFFTRARYGEYEEPQTAGGDAGTIDLSQRRGSSAAASRRP
jgi:hypothetical protein